VYETLEVAASDPLRFYVSGVRGSGVNEQGVVLVSADGGKSWTEHAVPLNTNTERAPYVSAVDPKNADRVYVRTKGSAGSRLLVSDDGAKTFREVLAMTGDMLGFKLSPDGQKVYVGGPKDGLEIASAADLAFTKKSNVGVTCLGVNGPKLYACANESDGFIFGESEDDGVTFAPKLHLWSVRGPLTCAPSSTHAQCLPAWPALRDSLATAPGDGGEDDGGASSSGGSSGGSSGSHGGCAVDATPVPSAAVLGAIAAAIALALARKKRRG
jgi:hypothetical protein